MKKTITTFCLLLMSLFALQANAELWLIGAISPDGWVPNKGVGFDQVDSVNYTLDLEVTKTGQQYYSLTTMLGATASDWNTIKPYRFGGTNLKVELDTETELVEGTDDSPYTIFDKAGTYTFTFNVETHIIKVTLKEESQDQPTPFNGTIYVTKTSTGNIWAWDAAGNYSDAWPGQDITTLETATVNGEEYYKFTYDHNSTAPGLIFNDGTSQTPDLTPVDKRVYDYNGGSTVTVTDLGDVVDLGNDIFILGEVNGNSQWATNVGLQMATEDNITYFTDVVIEGTNGGYNYFSFTHKLMDGDQDWEAIAPYRFGAVSNDFEITNEILDQEIDLGPDGTSCAFKAPAGIYTITLNIQTRKITFSGTIYEPIEASGVYVMGDVNENGGWFANVGTALETTDNVVYSGDITTLGQNDGYSYFGFTRGLAEGPEEWNRIAHLRMGPEAEGDTELTSEVLGETIELKAGYTTAFKAAAGTYHVVVDLNAMTVVFTQENVLLKGDVNRDGKVNVSDVTALVNMILGVINKDEESADVNHDGKINVSDVTALINIILGVI